MPKRVNFSLQSDESDSLRFMKIPHPLVIFAGGKSSRMGRDKALLPFDGYPTLTEYQIARFTPYFENIYVGCKSREKFDFEANFIEDLPRYNDIAPHIGLISAFERLQDTYICVLSVDTPFFSHKAFQKLLTHTDTGADAIIAQSPRGYQPLCAIYKKSTLPHLKTLTDQKCYRFSDLFAQIKTSFVPFENEEIFTNLNTPDEYHKVIQHS